jgi:hypothetical protein
VAHAPISKRDFEPKNVAPAPISKRTPISKRDFEPKNVAELIERYEAQESV